MNNPSDLFSFGDSILTFSSPSELKFSSYKESKSSFIVKSQFDSINDATKLVGHKLYLPDSVLKKPNEDEFYYKDLIGLKVVDSEINTIGEVIAVNNYGSCDILDIKCLDNKEVSLPFTKEFTSPPTKKHIVVSIPDELL